ncbi:unnamed protein product [Calypogeia fissa]
MGNANGREGVLEDSESDDEFEESSQSFHSADDGESNAIVKTVPGTSASPSGGFTSSKGRADVLSHKLGGLKLTPGAPSSTHNRAKLYFHTGGSTSKSQWTVYNKEVPWEYVKEEDEGDSDEEDERWNSKSVGKEEWVDWVLKVGDKVSAKVDDTLQLHYFDNQLRVDFVWKGVWAMKFKNKTDYQQFVQEFQNCKFENDYRMKATEANKTKVFGKDFMTWATGEDADESIWEDAEDHIDEQQIQLQKRNKLRETYNEVLKGGAKSLTMGAGDLSFLIGNSGIDVFKNSATGMHGKSVSMKLPVVGGDPYLTPKKGLLVRGETNMMLLSPNTRSQGVSQLDLEAGKVVSEWKFQKDGTPVSMKDLTNDSKGAQLGSSSTFLGLDDNQLCRWDMRVQQGIVQQLASPTVNLDWTEGHQFSRGTNFNCFATTGDGAVVVGSRDGKVRLYGTTSMRQAKTAFPGLGSPITHVDVTYDGKWILATTDTYMILISTLFKDKDGKTKTGFTGRMGSRIAAPRLLKLNPVDAHAAGEHKFSGGQFSWVTESGKQERHLVASVGTFSVVWDFQRVKQTDHECYRHEKGLKSCYCYEIVPKDESVVESRFMNDTFHSIASPEAPLVVATPKKISSYYCDI